MLYVQRDANGGIAAVSTSRQVDFQESLAEDDPDLRAFLLRAGGGVTTEALASTDIGLVRVVEDLVTALVERGAIRFTDLPEEARLKLSQRQGLRHHLRGVNPVDEDDAIL
jgi:hypothetical protein